MERFWSKVEVASPGCWWWTAARIGPGYGSFRLEGKSRLAHRLAYQMLVGPIPDGLELDHLCRNRACVNPDHLEPVTHAENIRRGAFRAVHRANRLAHKTCSQGHPYDGVRPDGARSCSTCRRDISRRHVRELATCVPCGVSVWQLPRHLRTKRHRRDVAEATVPRVAFTVDKLIPARETAP